MATIKVTAEGKVITKGGLPSCACCDDSSSSGSSGSSSSSCICNFYISFVYFDQFFGIDFGYFTVHNGSDCDLTVIAYNGPGILYEGLPFVIPPFGNHQFSVNLEGVSQLELETSPFFVVTEECGNSESNTFLNPDSSSDANPWGVVVLTFSWTSGKDLDTGVTFLGSTVGFAHVNDSPYMTSDYDGADIVTGPEVVTINLAAAWEAGAITDTAVINIAADWFTETGAGVYVAFSGDINPEGGASSFAITPGPRVHPRVSPATTSVGTLTISSDNLGFTFP